MLGVSFISSNAQKELEKYLRKIEDLTGTPPASLKKGKDGAGSTPGGSALTTTGTKPKDSNLIDNLGQGLSRDPSTHAWTLFLDLDTGCFPATDV